jgi:predicted phosphohydrolase
MHIAITADLHWGHRRWEEATLLLCDILLGDPPDLLLITGDVGTGQDFAGCLALFDDLACRKALVPGNHDIWVEQDDARGNSLQVYHDHLPCVCAAHDFHYLDHGPLLLPEAGLAVVGSINWYDYSWSLAALRTQVPDWEERLRTKTFLRGRHNDARFVRWPLDDVRFTVEVVATLDRHLHEALTMCPCAIVMTHHPPFQELSFPRPDPPSVDSLLWDAFTGNKALPLVLARYADRVPFVFCGHTHRARESQVGPIRGYNVGGDYHFKRLLLLDWPASPVADHTFGDPDKM